MLSFIFTLAGLLIIVGAVAGYFVLPYVANSRFEKAERLWRESGGDGESRGQTGRAGPIDLTRDHHRGVRHLRDDAQQRGLLCRAGL
ncbi:MAG: hypothetical protein C0624_02370 [Desulfuromonas sp.]|nr:MAG: hypothetical protein C0624_02370 [Desulfuromonas sp.]